MKSAYQEMDGNIDQTEICANFDRSWEFYDLYAVYTLDFSELKIYYQEMTVPDCPMDDYNYWITPTCP
jgi:hypothetical protein